MAWLSGWQYRKSHVINSASGAGTNYQVKIKVYYGTGTDSGENVYLNGKCKTDFGDIRFTRSDGATLLDYWMESKVDSDNAVFWVEVADDLSTNPVTIYIYYGNATATTTSNGANTFLFFDDFLGTDIDTTKWSVSSHTGTRTVSNSILTLTGGESQNELYVSIPTFGLNCMCEMKANFVSSDGSSYTVILLYGTYVCARIGEWSRAGWGTTLQWEKTDISATTHGTLNAGGYNAWYIYSSVRLSGSAKYFVNRNLVSTQTANWAAGNSQIELLSSFGSQLSVDWVLVRKYVDPEPSHGSWGSEETSQVTITRVVVEYLAGYDVKSRMASLYRVKTDYVGLLDSGFKKLGRNIKEYIGLFESKFKKLSKIFSDYVGLLDLTSKISTLHRIFSENIGLLDSIIHGVSGYIYRTVIEYIGLLDIKSRISSLHRTLIEYLGLLDTKIKKLSKVLKEYIGLLDIKSRISTLHKTFIEYVGLLDSSIHGIVGYIYRIVTEYIGLLDSKIRTVNLHRIFIEQLGVLESKVKSLSKTFIEYVGLYDLSEHWKNITRRIIAEFIELKDAVSKRKHLMRVFIEYVTVAETRIISKALHKIIVEYLGVKERYYKLPSFFKYFKWRRFQHPKQRVEVNS